MKRIILITGGARSGKSTYAEKLALELSPTPVYLATARIWDEEFRQRVIRHQERRGPEWTNIEEQKELSRHRLEGRIVLIDCITLWCTNFFFDLHSDTDRALAAVKAEFDRFTAQDATFIFVTNEIRLDEPICSRPCRRSDTDGIRHPTYRKKHSFIKQQTTKIQQTDENISYHPPGRVNPSCID
jgi:adenosylcobinamide kinase/adenosylcobinamide-phosphate guanylyltransferase